MCAVIEVEAGQAVCLIDEQPFRRAVDRDVLPLKIRHTRDEYPPVGADDFKGCGRMGVHVAAVVRVNDHLGSRGGQAGCHE